LAGQIVLTAVLSSGLYLLVQRYLADRQHQKNLERDRLQERTARERERWNELRARVSPLLKTAGELETHLGGWAMSHHADEIKALLRELNAYPAQFADYPDVRQAIWAFQNTAHNILDDGWDFLTNEQREVRE
jgi:hypothetical protein